MLEPRILTTTTIFISQNGRKPERATAHQSWLLRCSACSFGRETRTLILLLTRRQTYLTFVT